MALVDHAPTLRCLSTDGIKESDRCEFWRASTVPVFGSLEVKLLENRVFDGSFQFTTVSDLIFSRIASRTPHRVVTTQITLAVVSSAPLASLRDTPAPSSPRGQSQMGKSTSSSYNHRMRLMAKAFPSQIDRFSLSGETASARFAKISQIDNREDGLRSSLWARL
jgi:hypothetical protein